MPASSGEQMMISDLDTTSLPNHQSSSSPRLLLSPQPTTCPDQDQLKSPRKKDQVTTRKKLKRLAYGPNYIPEEETIRNDYSLHYVLTGSRPQNQIQNPGLATRFAEHPKLKRLLELKQSVVTNHAHRPFYLQAELRPSHPNYFNLLDLHPSRFDVIVLDPPLQEYSESYPEISLNPPNSTCGGPPEAERPWWTWDELEALPVPQIAASPGFIFLWCGTGQGKGLEQGRALLSKWGYRKCEDLVWVKTNHDRRDETDKLEGSSKTKTVFRPTKEHCLMGIRGTVRRSTDGHFVNCNVDTDVVVADADPDDPLHKPVELYNVIENFCLGHRRLELFGSKHSLRRGWLTIGTQCAPDETQLSDEVPIADRPTPYVKQDYISHFLDPTGRTQNLLPSNPEIEALRPRSPPGRIGSALAGPSGAALPRGLGLGMPGSGSIPIGPGLMTGAISGRNTVSHPSGGLGRGPGNALLPGMRVSGFRDGGNPMAVPGSANYKDPNLMGSPKGRENRYKQQQQPHNNPLHPYYPHQPFGYQHMQPFQMAQAHQAMMNGGGGMGHAANMMPQMMFNQPMYPQQNWMVPTPQYMGYPQFPNHPMNYNHQQPMSQPIPYNNYQQPSPSTSTPMYPNVPPFQPRNDQPVLVNSFHYNAGQANSMPTWGTGLHQDHPSDGT